MAKATRRGPKRRAVSKSEKVLGSLTQTLPSAENTIPSAGILGLANETLFFIAGCLEERDLWALCLANRRLNSIAAPVLWNRLHNDPFRPQEVLLWAVEAGRNDLLQILLDRKVSPNFHYLSSLLRSRLRDVLATQGRHGAVGPRNDRALQAEIFREKYCRSAAIRKRVRYVRRINHVGWPMTDDDLEWNLTHGANDEHTCSLEWFGIGPKLGDLEDRQYWGWAPLHVAVLLGNIKAVRLLLDHGADVNAQCSGLCDCAAPDLTGASEPNDSVSPHRNRSVWTALHVAMCTGNEEAVQLLISRNASVFVGNLIRQPYGGLLRKPRLGTTVFQSAAWLGSVRLCRIFLGVPLFKFWLDHGNRQQQTAIHYAAAAGHIRTVGKLLLEHGAVFPFYEGETPCIGTGWPPKIRHDPLRLLCMQFKYEDARWLITFARRLYRDRLNPKPAYTRALASLCALRAPAMYSQLSLREQQDHLYSLTSDDLDDSKREVAGWQAVQESQRNRISLARRLLDLGADPNEAERTYRYGMPVLETGHRFHVCHRTSLQLAASCGYTQMVKLLLTRGADCNKIGGPREQLLPPPPATIMPLMLAVYHALTSGKGDLETVEAVLKAGPSLDNVDGSSVLRTLQNFEPTSYDGKPPANIKAWCSIADMILSRGAATRTSEANWADIVIFACKPGNLTFCKLLAASRPFSTFQRSTLTSMVRRAAFGSNGPVRGGKEDVELLTWVLRHCLNANGGLIVETWQLEEFARMAASASLDELADVLRDFAMTNG